MKEIWKIINGFNNYEISNLGRVKNVSTGRVLKGVDNGWGYLQVNLFKAGKGYMRKIHRLVATAFIENPEKLGEVNHRDEDKANNAVSNLEWCSHEYNINYGTRNERIGKANSVAMLGKNSKAVKCIETGETFKSARDAARKYNIPVDSVCNAANPNQLRKTACGFTWCYV